MEPRHYAGDLVVAQRGRPRHKGDSVVIEVEDGQAGWVVEYVTHTKRRLHLREYNPRREIMLPLRVASRMLRVMTMADLVVGPFVASAPE